MVMFAAVRRAFGAIKVIETATDIQVAGVPADILARDISKIWSTNRINAWMFTALGKNSFSFPKFFAIEVHYMLQQIDEYRYSKSSIRTIRAITQQLEEHTWLKQLDEEVKSRVDQSQLHQINAKLFPHQDGFLNAYGELTQRYNLDGYLCAADPGTGKTIMSLALALCLHSDLTVIVSPKIALNRVWTNTMDWLYKKPIPYWVTNSGEPYKGQKIILCHYEAIPKALEAARHASHHNCTVILDESHNLNEIKSQRTLNFLDLCKQLNSKNVIWASGTPLKAMGYEVVPLLRSIDPLFTHAVEERFLKIFGKESGRALDILRNRIGKMTYRVSAGEVIANSSSDKTLEIKIPNSEEYTLDAIRTKMRAFIDERMTYYLKNFKSYRANYDAGIAAFEKVMSPDQKADLKRYNKAVAMISKGYDPVEMKEEAAFANHFEKKVIIPSITNAEVRNKFKESRSVIKYLKLRVVGEALGNIVGKARAQCHVDMVPHIPWEDIIANSEKKIVVFTSYVEALKAVEAHMKKIKVGSLLVYGDTNANVAGIVNRFDKDEKVKVLAATYQSLSTAVPLTMASTAIFLNAPWRDHELVQAKARIDRIGADTALAFIHTFLDTGKAPNISTRSKDILEWSKAQVEAMLGSVDNAGIATELNKDYNRGAMESFMDPGTQFVSVFESHFADLL